jgi:hypothetical protein
MHRLITLCGRTQPLAAWLEELGLSVNTFKKRVYKMGWSHEKALTTPTKKSGTPKTPCPRIKIPVNRATIEWWRSRHRPNNRKE